MKEIIAHDTETELISKEQITPDWICSSLAFINKDTGEVTTALFSEMSEGHEDVHKEIFSEDNDHIVVYHNASFDLRVITRDSQEMMDLVWKKLMRCEVKDTLIREKLLNLAEWGNIDNPNGKRAGYAQADLEKKYLGIDRSELKAAGSVRTLYSEVRDIPVEEWTEDFSEYAKDDAKYCLMIYMEQELRNNELISSRGINAFTNTDILTKYGVDQESFRVQYAFALALMTADGLKVDKERLVEVRDRFAEAYAEPDLVDPLIEAGFLRPAVPPMPYKNMAKEHSIDCAGHKDHPEHSKKIECDCPIKMKAGVKEGYSTKTLHQYIWDLARSNPEVEVYAGDATIRDLRLEGSYKDFCGSEGLIKASVLEEHDTIPKGWRVKADADWLDRFAHLDHALNTYKERKTLEKMITTYLPKMFYTDEETGEEVVADRVHADYDVVKRTGRTSSYGGKLYPSMNGQQVDPRIRPCFVADDGYSLVSIDYNGMELGTLAQTCIDLFGKSVLSEVINAGEDSHAFLGAQIAYELDSTFKEYADVMRTDNNAKTSIECVWSDYRFFKELKTFKDECESPEFRKVWESKYKEKDLPCSWAVFFKHYRTFAKPTGLGFPGGLMPKTFIQYARNPYKVEVDLATAERLRAIWLNTFTEMGPYLDHVKQSRDPHHAPEKVITKDGREKRAEFLCYDTPLGLHRAKTTYCPCANGRGLQSPSAEGAGMAVIEVQRLIFTTNDSIISRVGKKEAPVRCSLFIHDEIVGQFLMDGKETERVRFIEKVLKDKMEIITPDVTAGTEPAMSMRWYKQMEPVYNEAGNLIPWKPKEK